MAIGDVKILGDSNLVLSQITEDFKCLSRQLRPFHSLATSLMNQFDNVQLKFWIRGQNKKANNIAQSASGIRVPVGMEDQLIKITRKTLPSTELRNTMLADSWVIDIEDLDDDDWRIPFIMFLRNPNIKADRGIKRRAINFLLFDGDLYRKGLENGLLLQCINKEETLQVMTEVHEGSCGAH
ncbi:uncharacterized protein LOC132313886 [Cornus florida]|uniref:uncharacterized protein LOC132313886 n=1 Tax=Cornus florida TaxID=4283 RepID=UPI00289D6B62|nr:uncharacterized protein LOC132313886 [Cornus florida]